jgi:hypothetical protein
MQLVSLRTAIENGLKRYFTGIPCKPKGHISEKHVSSKACIECDYEKKAEKRKQIPDYRRAYTKEYWKRTKAKQSEAHIQWRENNRGKRNAITANRRANLLNATPSWIDRLAIREIYENCPEGHHVDHIVPLKGKTVCGLHVPANLQYLPASANLSKNNRFQSE